MIPLEAHAAGTILPVKAHAAARRNAVKLAPDALHVSVTAAPEKGKANKAILTLLAKSLGLRKSQLELLSGETSQHKRVLVRGITPSDLQNRVQALA
jgi:uncharacterized protein (TIGR00251 family)